MMTSYRDEFFAEGDGAIAIAFQTYAVFEHLEFVVDPKVLAANDAYFDWYENLYLVPD